MVNLHTYTRAHISTLFRGGPLEGGGGGGGVEKAKKKQSRREKQKEKIRTPRKFEKKIRAETFQ